MNTAEIGAFIKKPQDLGSEQVLDLKNLCEAHPYSGLLHLLYLKALGNARSIDFDSELNHYAIKIPNRALLYQMIHEGLEDIQIVENSATIEESVLEFSPERIAFEIEENPVVEAPTIAVEVISEEKSAIEEVAHEELDSEQQFEIQENESDAEELVELPVEEADDTPIAIEEIEETHLLVDDAVEESVDETHENEPQVNVEVIAEQTVDSQDEDERIFAENFVESPFEEVSWLDNTITFEGFEDSLNYDTETEEDAEQELAPISFDVEALLEGTISIETDIAEEITPESKQYNEESPASVNRKSFYDWLNVSAEEEKPSDLEQKPLPLSDNLVVEEVVAERSDAEEVRTSEPVLTSEKDKVQSLVDKFIEAEPRISRPKAEFFSPVKSAKESVSEDGIPVSETLAKIYELQGNYPKAIAVFEKLMELLPNKRERFEMKIAEIKAKMVG